MIFKRIKAKLARLGLIKMSDEQFLKLIFSIVMDYELDLENPLTFNEKLQWLKIHDRKPEYVKMVDKRDAKQFVAEKIGADYIIPTIGVYEKFEDIDFDELPNQFVIKCTHDSGGVIIVKDKKAENLDNVKSKINESLKKNYYYSSREWPYKNIRPRIIIEKLLPELDNDVIDYKFMCFDGKVKIIFTCSERHSEDGLKVTWFTPDWKKLNFTRHYPNSKKPIAEPKSLKKMIEIAEKLSEGIPFVRIDLYNIDGKIYFGEYTFYPGAGFEEFDPPEWDKKLGDLIDLSKVEKNEK